MANPTEAAEQIITAEELQQIIDADTSDDHVPFDQFERAMIKPRSQEFLDAQAEQAADRYCRNQDRIQRGIADVASTAALTPSGQDGETIGQELDAFLAEQGSREWVTQMEKVLWPLLPFILPRSC